MNIISNLAEPVVCDSANYTDNEGNYYPLISIETDNVKSYEVGLMNNKIVPNFAEGVEED
ncbi:hypothetical protein PDK45_25105 [Bacillus cereus]|nr:hypothetical protein [Bacillus cereus]